MILFKKIISSGYGYWSFSSESACNDFSLAKIAPSSNYECRANIKWDEKTRTVTVSPFHVTSSAATTEKGKMEFIEKSMSTIENLLRAKFKKTPTGRPSTKAIKIQFVLGERRYDYFTQKLGYKPLSYSTVYKEL